MSLDFYMQDDAGLEMANGAYRQYLEHESTRLVVLGSMDLREYHLLAPWVAACQAQGLMVGDFFSDTMLPSTALPPARALLEQIYHQRTGRTLAGHDDASPANPYRKMDGFLRQAGAAGCGILGICD